ncbi:MAG TPA: DUF5615 family PIN-like protein [Tepidisphaeraceae bacterium]|nr:DUF5615 family PIN-like protein [Tepidisphaeraceae bacterium]
MKLLIDENLPHELRHLLQGHDVFTVSYMGWNGIQNGELLARAAANGFDALLTLDSGIQFQQNLSNLACAVVVLHAKSNRMADVRPLLDELRRALGALIPRSIVHLR